MVVVLVDDHDSDAMTLAEPPNLLNPALVPYVAALALREGKDPAPYLALIDNDQCPRAFLAALAAGKAPADAAVHLEGWRWSNGRRLRGGGGPGRVSTGLTRALHRSPSSPCPRWNDRTWSDLAPPFAPLVRPP